VDRATFRVVWGEAEDLPADGGLLADRPRQGALR